MTEAESTEESVKSDRNRRTEQETGTKTGGDKNGSGKRTCR
ncbi:hypothetical protein AMURIS_00924 [Acetatifactor muris]|uniref:Uncharacterized protein n=1 Tax=Acetatifactor muris TaxID=879566 RepID=A0A2K4ZCM8_9FIRM|nr:hypothetical protein AMURIS_00924 [Acetatifactor muris]